MSIRGLSDRLKKMEPRQRTDLVTYLTTDGEVIRECPTAMLCRIELRRMKGVREPLIDKIIDDRGAGNGVVLSIARLEDRYLEREEKIK